MGQELERYQAPNTRASLPALSVDELRTVAKAMTASGMFNIAKGGDFGQGVASAFVQLLVGQELGISIGQAMSNIHVIDGKPTFSAALMGALVKRHPAYDYRIIESSNDRCRIEWFELSARLDEDGWPRQRSIGISEFTMAEAAQAGLKDKTNWKKYPKAMLLARAMTAGSRAYAPDVFNGPVYTPDEIEAGETTDIGPIMVEQQPITEVLEDGSVVDTRTGEIVMPAGSVPAEAVEGEHIPPDPVDKASEMPPAGEQVTDAEVVEDPPAAQEEAARPAQPPRTQDVPLLTPAQLRLIQKRKGEAGLDDEMLHIVVLALAGVESLKELPKDDVTQVVAGLERLKALKDDPDGFAAAFGEYVEAAAVEAAMPS